ncbi:hypothetical protein AB0O64_22685 [Streptomyces sp. NPDC088341]|uniref:hypothetical protein n=1 Tax=Streptomyces sp. NPDC088341 TaxID=3154870 RepID=UPI0034162BE2
MRDWGDRWVLGDGSLTATAAEDGAEHARTHSLTGTRPPAALALPGSDGIPRDAVAPDAGATVHAVEEARRLAAALAAGHVRP